ncbi:uncharacterized protein LOC143433510 [Xylocopa sonorina]|uniref:uncharacterized protein LOC143433510 n=1 Tax=Xylocopa sonorina TaxID=1818115 RepID=UPI00403B0182
MTVQTPYLDAIQAVPGDTPTEKFSWMAKLLKERLAECNSLEDIVECEKIPRPLAPLMQIQAAMMLNKKDRQNQSAYSAIAEALKSGDAYVVNIALRARSFFDGTNKTITNVRYFFDNLFPHVSLKTRRRIIKNLALYLGPENSDLAEEFFTAVASFYDLQQALPLLVACGESFAYDTIVEKRIVLNRKLIKRLMRKNPDFVVRYFRLSKPVTDTYARNVHSVNIHTFSDFLMALIKKRLDSFVELYEMHEEHPIRISMSNKCAEAFLKNGKEYLQRKPKLYIELLPIKMISASCMEAIFPKLFPENFKTFETDRMLSYLKYYPQDKKVDFFLKTYRQVYGKNVLDDTSKVTPMLMRMLPSEERVRQAKIKLETDCNTFGRTDYNTSWECYLTIEESIPHFKQEMTKTKEMELRSTIACKMIYSCKVNNDYQALQQVLSYLADRHKNEQSWFQMKVFHCLLDFYDLPQIGNDHWAILTDMIMRTHVKREFNLMSNSIRERIVEAAIHHKILQNQPIDQMIEVLLEIFIGGHTARWNILVKYPEYERMCLEACMKVLERKYETNTMKTDIAKSNIVLDIAISIYYFNKRHVNKTSRVERMSIKNYPWLLASVEEVLSKMTEKYTAMRLKSLLMENERDLHDRLCPNEEDVIDMSTIQDLNKLKKNPSAVLARWKEYLEVCRRNSFMKYTKRFLLATRWYKDIPIRFVEHCLTSLTDRKNVLYFDILALLVHGDTFTKIIEPYIPTNNTMDIHDANARTTYEVIQNIIQGMRVVNPPISLSIVAKLCEGDYLTSVLSAIRNICGRTNATDVISFARMLASQRVSVRKHGVRMMHMVAGRDQLFQFLRALWKNEENHSMRIILFSKITQLFRDEPTPDAWSLLVDVISTLTPNDKELLTDFLSLINLTPDEYVVDFVKLAYTVIDKLGKAGVKESETISYMGDLLTRIDMAICYLLPDDFIKEFLQRFFTHYELNVPHFVFTHLLVPARDKFDDRMKMFSGVFTEIVKTGWNVPHPKNPRFYPVNHSVLRFVHAVNSEYFSLKVEPRVIDEILSMFLSVLTPQMDPTSYLLLVYTKDRASATTIKEFGTKIGQRIPELISTFSQLFTCIMASTLRTTLDSISFDDKSELIEGLMELGTLEATFIAIQMLPSANLKEHAEGYDQLMMRFVKYDHPLIKSLAYLMNNTTEFID